MQYNQYIIHPEAPEIERLISELGLWDLSLREVVDKLFRWFDGNVAYSRLNAPYYPLQRSDLDVLRMGSGTCGDYTNLVVSVLTRLGYRMQYAFVLVDCCGDPQQHICAAVWHEGRWQLIDPTLPYRKWHGLDCPHRAREPLPCTEMKTRLLQDERYWTDKAIAWGKAPFAGLLYAPWLHEEIVLSTAEALETVFFLLILDSVCTYTLYVYYLIYSRTAASSPILCRITREGTSFRFSVHPAQNLWDERQWGEAYANKTIPERYRSERLSCMQERIDRIVPRILNLMNP